MAVAVSIFQTVHVVSIEDVTTRLGAFSFQEKLVKGAPVFWLCTFDCYRRVSTNFEVGKNRPTPDKAVFRVKRCPPPLGCLPTYADDAGGASPKYSQTLNASPVVASNSADGVFPDQGKPPALAGCHCKFVAGYP